MAVHAQLGVNASKFEAWENHTDGTVSAIAHSHTVTQPRSHTAAHTVSAQRGNENCRSRAAESLTGPRVNEAWGAREDHQPTIWLPLSLQLLLHTARLRFLYSRCIEPGLPGIALPLPPRHLLSLG